MTKDLLLHHIVTLSSQIDANAIGLQLVDRQSIKEKFSLCYSAALMH